MRPVSRHRRARAGNDSPRDLPLFPFASLQKNLSEDLNIKSIHKKNRLESDFEVFYDRWHSICGAGFSENMYEINHVYPTAFLKDDTFEERLPPQIVRRRAAAQAR